MKYGLVGSIYLGIAVATIWRNFMFRKQVFSMKYLDIISDMIQVLGIIYANLIKKHGVTIFQT